MAKVLAIAGMHRSGTSLTANWLHNCGLNMGQNLMKPAFANKKGHFEDWEIVNIHETDLREKGLHTTGLRTKNRQIFLLSDMSEKKLLGYIKKRSVEKQWAWKEPRGTLYLESWKKNILKMRCLAVYRPYNEVVNSLVRRTHYTIFKTKIFRFKNRLLLQAIYPLYIRREINNYAISWIKYNQSILNYKKKYPKDCLLFSINDIKNKNAEVFKIIQDWYNFDLTYYNFYEIYDKKLFNDTVNTFSYSNKLLNMLKSTSNELEQECII
ncbi:MAG: hypothetical protein L3J35_12495 [Bacteroidales bacterium]|nr:hypothetical protein [Bacteroidales bacterium]